MSKHLAFGAMAAGFIALVISIGIAERASAATPVGSCSYPAAAMVSPSWAATTTSVAILGNGFNWNDYVEFRRDGIISGLGGKSLSSVTPNVIRFNINGFFMKHMKPGAYDIGVAPYYGGPVTDWQPFTVR
ncbi:hypothetical protein KGP36_00990 [Patescibacteria group bacterium]|nr:hypothetical protein [Patescibacteria group bacterium]MDE1940920.1 hypothetical protein [Patescibacteria group bacterium]